MSVGAKPANPWRTGKHWETVLIYGCSFLQVLLCDNMGSDFSKRICCVTCGRCKKQGEEEANEETSETKPILQTSRETSTYTDTQPSTPALEVSKGPEEVQSLSQNQWPSADAVEETCFAVDPMGTTEGWEAAWGSTDSLVASAEGETKGVQFLNQVNNQHERERVSNAEEKINPVSLASEAQPVTHVAQDAEPAAEEEQPDEQAGAGSEGSPCAGITLQERNIFNFIELASETAAGQDCEIKPPAEIRRNTLLCAVEMAEETETHPSAEQEEEMDRATLAGISPQSAERAELTSLLETAPLLTVEDALAARELVDLLEVIVNDISEKHFTSAVPSVSLCPERDALEPANQLLDFLQQETQPSLPAAQEMESLCCAEPAEPSKVLHQSSDGVFGELEDEGKECDAATGASEAEPLHRIMQQTELPEEPVTCVQTPVKQEAEFLNVVTSLSEELGSGGEIEAEDGEASET